MKKQSFFPGNIARHKLSLISAMGLDHPAGGYVHYPEWTHCRQGKSWGWQQICRHDTFLLVASEGRHSSADDVAYTQWEDYIKVNFWLGGKHTTVLDGFGQFEHDRPEAFIVCAPRETTKVDLIPAGTRTGGIALCLARDFFPTHLGIAAEELPEPLRSMATPAEKSYGFHQFPLTSDLVAATRAILSASFTVRRQPVYGQAKAVELMCLLIDQMSPERRRIHGAAQARAGRESRLHDARELLTRRYAEAITLDQISREVGLNRMALTSGFRRLFGMSVHDCLQKERMERAFELLQDDGHTIAQVAQAVGYSHASTFSTAFHGYYGSPPQKARFQEPHSD